jgi:hypothetical protein
MLPLALILLLAASIAAGCGENGEAEPDDLVELEQPRPADQRPSRHAPYCEREGTRVHPFALAQLVDGRVLRVVYSSSSGLPPCELRARNTERGLEVTLRTADPEVVPLDLRPWCAVARLAEPLVPPPRVVHGASGEQDELPGAPRGCVRTPLMPAQ